MTASSLFSIFGICAFTIFEASKKASSLFSIFGIFANLNANHMLPQGCAFMLGLKNGNIVSGHFLVGLHFKTGS